MNLFKAFSFQTSYKKNDWHGIRCHMFAQLDTYSIFERLIYNEMFTLFTENNVVSPNQSGFRPGKFCVNKLLAITHKIYKSFDERFDVREIT